MSAAAAVLVCALEILGRSANQLPPIRIVAAPPPDASPTAEAFVDRSDGTINLIASAPSFRLAQKAQQARGSTKYCVERRALKMIASIIAHEEWHLQHGPDERGAYETQISTLNRLGLGPGTAASVSVTRAMQTVLEAQKRSAAPERALAAARRD